MITHWWQPLRLPLRQGREVVRVSGAGLGTENKIASDVKAYIDGSSLIRTTTGDIKLSHDISTITAEAMAASVGRTCPAPAVVRSRSGYHWHSIPSAMK